VIALKLPQVSLVSSAIILCTALLTATSAYLITPKLTLVAAAPKLQDVVPHAFGDWVEIKSPLVQVALSENNEKTISQPYDQTLMRAYRNQISGKIVFIALAYGENQRQEIKIHRPELCYVAQGYRVDRLDTIRFDEIRNAGGAAIVGKHMYAEKLQSSEPGRGEAVSYWIRIGNFYSDSPWSTRLYIVREGFKGRMVDGVLVRASMQIDNQKEAQQAYPVIDRFLKDFADAVPDNAKGVLIR
jgi:EpsI family protein